MVKMSQNDVEVLKMTRALHMALNAAMDRRKSVCLLRSPDLQVSSEFSDDSPVERYSNEKDEADTDVKRFEDEYSIYKRKALEIVAKMRGTKQRFSVCYYVMGMSLSDVAYEIDRSYRQALRIRDAIEGGVF